MNQPTEKSARPSISGTSRPQLSPHVKMRHDAARDRHIILGPERVFTPDDIALAILKLCDGHRTVQDIGRELAGVYDAPVERILADIVAMLQELADKGIVRA
jgi:pyrroloquinoline quinone biosynthesis protein D